MGVYLLIFVFRGIFAFKLVLPFEINSYICSINNWKMKIPAIILNVVILVVVVISQTK